MKPNGLPKILFNHLLKENIGWVKDIKNVFAFNQV